MINNRCMNTYFKGFIALAICVLYMASGVNLYSQDIPLVYDIENTGVNCHLPVMPSLNALQTVNALPDPFRWSDGSGCVANINDWRCRRAEIGAMIQHYEIGTKPAPPGKLSASFSDDSILTVTVIVNDDFLDFNLENHPACWSWSVSGNNRCWQAYR